MFVWACRSLRCAQNGPKCYKGKGAKVSKVFQGEEYVKYWLAFNRKLVSSRATCEKRGSTPKSPEVRQKNKERYRRSIEAKGLQRGATVPTAAIYTKRKKKESQSESDVDMVGTDDDVDEVETAPQRKRKRLKGRKSGR